MAFALPAFIAVPVAVIADEAAVTRAELTTYRTTILAWDHGTRAQLLFLNPIHGFVLPLPAAPAVNLDQDERILYLATLRQYVGGLYPIYAAAYVATANALIGAAAPPPPPPPPPAPAIRPPKTQLPNQFHGKSPALARHFLQQCVNYIAIAPFPDHPTEIRWALQLLDGEAAPWRDAQLAKYQLAAVPANLLDWDLFVDLFNARWTDPHEAEKALDRIMNHTIKQKTSVKVYNDLFNEAMVLANVADTNTMLLRAYETGLKPAVRNAAVGPLMYIPNPTFEQRQSMMVRLDETLQQTAQRETPFVPRTVINNPVFNVANPTPSRDSTPARGSSSTPIKVETARQYTRLTPAEREELRRTGGCFCCRQKGHMASQCPRNAQVAAVESAPAPVPAPAAPAPAPDAPVPAPASQDF